MNAWITTRLVFVRSYSDYLLSSPMSHPCSFSAPLFQHTARLICGSLERNSEPFPMLASVRVLLAAPLLLATVASAQTATLIESLPFFADGTTSLEDPEVFTLIPAEERAILLCSKAEGWLADRLSRSPCIKFMGLGCGAGWGHQRQYMRLL